MSIALKSLNCPFCGGSDISEGEVLAKKPSGRIVTQSMCTDCGALGPEASIDKPDYGSVKATEAWNRRIDTAMSGTIKGEKE